MKMRSVPARWFEILTARDDLTLTLETLARTGNVELETRSEITRQAAMPELHDRMEEYNRLARRYMAFWPQPDTQTPRTPGKPKDKLDHALEHLYAWQQLADPVIERIEALQNERTELNLLKSLLEHLGSENLDFSSITRAGPTLSSRLFVLPATSHVEHLPPAMLSLRASTVQHLFLLVVGTADDVDALQRDLTLQKGRGVVLPDWLEGNPAHAAGQVHERLEDIEQGLVQFQQQLDVLAKQHELGDALADIHQLEWFLTHVSDLPVSENFAWITGWTSDMDENHLGHALGLADVRAVIHFPAAPLNIPPPLVMHNPWWAKPFELFAKMLGTPAVDEADPSRLLAIIVPLLFGYMFGDVGHGMVLLLVGLIFYKRWPVLKLLIICGSSSIVFGFIFGSTFGNEHLIEPLWLHPIDEPLAILLVALAGGACIILLGLLLNSVEAVWRGELQHWLMVDAAVIVMYLAIITSFLSTWSATVFLLAMLWYFSGNLLLAKGGYLRTLGQAAGHLLENILQLIINTFSFIRVGAFALAHAGLSLAFVILAESTTNIILSGLILLLGNIIIIMLEGLVVFIQTTRLVLFEFFIRFLRGSGRMFRPLAAPDESVQQ
jgi:V/A-type H+-transporting ATPase subunit I